MPRDNVPQKTEEHLRAKNHYNIAVEYVRKRNETLVYPCRYGDREQTQYHQHNEDSYADMVYQTLRTILRKEMHIAVHTQGIYCGIPYEHHPLYEVILVRKIKHDINKR
jgi:hypothetical protein